MHEHVDYVKKFTSLPSTRAAVWDKTNGTCWYCGKQMHPFKHEFSIDHFIPSSKGGKDELSNLVPACKACNCGKNNRTIEEFRKTQAKNFGMYFSETQIKYLSDRGIEIPDDKYIFYFEEQNLDRGG